MLHELELGAIICQRVVRCTYIRQWPIAEGQRRGSEAQAKVRDGLPKRSPATLLLMGASTCTGQPGAVDWVLNWWSSVKLTGSHGGHWTNLRAGRGRPAGPTGLLARPPHVTPAGLPITGVPGSSLYLAAANRGCIGNWGMRRLPVLGSFSTPASPRGLCPASLRALAHFHFLA